VVACSNQAGVTKSNGDRITAADEANPMILVVQRVSRAEVRVDGETVGRVGLGLMVLLGVERADSRADADVLVRKLAALRIFPGRTPMDRSIQEVHGGCLVVSQFTLAGSIRKGNRPGFERAEEPAVASALYDYFVARLVETGIPVATGRFGAHMEVELVNDGPVTFILKARSGGLVEE
jgi:D-tyrosyl-tRNA(Tyr) deacylase